MKKDKLGDRIKANYENIFKSKLVRKIPVIIRIDGKAFHTFTHNFKKPFDDILATSMQETMKYLCENIQGCVFGYTQSDEISLVLTDYAKITSSAYFDYEVQKLCSIVASMTTMIFNKKIEQIADKYFNNILKEHNDIYLTDEDEKYYNIIKKTIEKGAMFDARCFNVPKEEVCNYLIWRQQDATRNSIQMVGRRYFSDRELENKNNNVIQDMLYVVHGINWNDYPTMYKRGTACIKVPTQLSNDTIRNKWVIDKEMPILTEDRNYIEQFI